MGNTSILRGLEPDKLISHEGSINPYESEGG